MDGFSPSVWNPVAPIKKVQSLSEMIAFVGEIERHVNSLEREYGDQIERLKDKPRTPHQPSDDQPQQAVSNSREMIESFLEIKSTPFTTETACVYVYQVAGHAAGLAMVSYLRAGPYLDKIMSNPFFFDVTAVFCEYILDEAVRRELPPQIELDALDETALGAYKAIGFVSETEDPLNMFLYPKNQADIWKNVGGKWKCIRSISRTSNVIPPQYRTGFEFENK